MNSVTDLPLRDTRKQAFEANKLSKKLHRQVGQAIADFNAGRFGRVPPVAPTDAAASAAETSAG